MRRFKIPSSPLLTRLLICIISVLLFAIVGEWFYLTHSRPRSVGSFSSSPESVFADNGLCSPPELKMRECPKCVSTDRSGDSTSPSYSNPTSVSETGKSQLFKKGDSKLWKSKEFGALVSSDQQNVFCGPQTSVLDYGSFGGHFLTSLRCGGDKVGVEPNPFYLEYANEHFASEDIQVVRSLEDVDRAVDLIVGSGTEMLEMDCAVCEMRKMVNRLEEDGKLLMIVPSDGGRGDHDVWKDTSRSSRIRSLNAHVLGNLMEKAGVIVCECYSEVSAWVSQDKQDYLKNKCDWCRRSLQHGQKQLGAKFSVCVGVKSPRLCIEAREKMELMKACHYVCQSSGSWPA